MARSLVVTAALVVVSACGSGLSPPPGGVLVKAEGGTIAAEVASTPEERRVGLMDRSAMEPDAGMLFIYPTPTGGDFWMRGTLIPLAIAFLVSDGPDRYRVVTIREMVPCPDEVADTDCPRYGPGAGQFYNAALETNAGWFTEHGVEVGDELRVEGELPEPTG